MGSCVSWCNEHHDLRIWHPISGPAQSEAKSAAPKHLRLLLSAGAKMLCVAGVHGERFERGTRARKKPHFCGKRKKWETHPPYKYS